MSVSFRAASGHAPPDRAGRARAAFMARFARVRAKIKGGDLNLPARLAAKALRRRVVGGGVLWLTVPRRGWRVAEVELVDVGGDHRAVLAALVHLRTATVVRVLVINCMSVSTGKLHAKSILRAGMALDPDVVLASECADFLAVDVAGAWLYAWDQPGALGSPESGCLVGARRKTGNMTAGQRLLGSRETREGGGIRERSIVRDRITMKETP